MVLLGLLAGNTSLRYGLGQGLELERSGRIEWSDLAARAPEVRRAGEAATLVVAGSVRDDLLERAAALLPARLWPPLVARRDFAIPLENRYRDPAEVGTDRLLNALAVRLAAGERAAVAVDFGTAISISVVSWDGAFVGGAIAPGGRALLRGLSEAAPRLPSVEPAAPERFIAASTRAAIECGGFWQVVGGVRALLAGILAELGTCAASPAVPLVLATGGEAPLFAPHVPAIAATVPDLTMRGLLAAYALCR